MNFLSKTKLSIQLAKNKVKKSFTVPYSQLLKEFKIDKFQIKNILTGGKFLFQSIQDKLEKSIQTNHEEVLLSQSRRWAKTITWILIGGTSFGISWLALAKTEEIVIAKGKLEPISGVVDVQMPISGIAKSILVEEGERVKKGQLLINLDSEVTLSRNRSITKNLQINKNILSKLDYLLKEGAVSEIQYLEQRKKVNELENKLKENEVNLKYQKIISPIAGTVFDLQPWGPGYVAQGSTPLLKIVPDDSLQASIEINSKSIGFVSIGKRADISIDSFPSSDFGVVEGEVIKISSDALAPDPRIGKDYRFPAYIKLDTQYLQLNQNRKLRLQPGMSLTANIKLRKVSYLQLLLSTFREKSESLKQI